MNGCELPADIGAGRCGAEAAVACAWCFRWACGGHLTDPDPARPVCVECADRLVDEVLAPRPVVDVDPGDRL